MLWQGFYKKVINVSYPKFLLLIDNSGSMYGEKIASLNLAVNNLFKGLANVDDKIEVAVITFGDSVNFFKFIPVSEIENVCYEARGSTKLSEAVALVSKLANKNTITVLISDGAFNDGEFTKTTLKGFTFAIAIGYDTDYEALASFTGDKSKILQAFDAYDAAGYMLFKVYN